MRNEHGNGQEYDYELTRDICYLYHIQLEYCGFMADLDYSNEFKLPYWARLKTHCDADEEFYKTGCLIFILLIALDKIDGSGDALSEIKDQCFEAVRSVVPHSESESKLKELVIGVLAVSDGNTQNGTLDKEGLNWAYQEYVAGYFRKSIRDSGI